MRYSRNSSDDHLEANALDLYPGVNVVLNYDYDGKIYLPFNVFIVNIRGGVGHWVLVGIKKKYEVNDFNRMIPIHFEISVLDSLPNSRREAEIKRYFKKYLALKYGFNVSNNKMFSFPFSDDIILMQNNGVDCGPLTIYHCFRYLVKNGFRPNDKFQVLNDCNSAANFVRNLIRQRRVKDSSINIVAKNF